MDYEELRLLLDRPAESMLRRLLNASPMAASLGIDGRIVFANPAVVRMWGYDRPSDMHGLSLFDLVSPEWHELLMLLWRARAEHSDPWTYELIGIRSDGSTFPYRITSLSFATDRGKVTAAYFELIDRCVNLEEQMDELTRRLAEPSKDPDFEDDPA